MHYNRYMLFLCAIVFASSSMAYQCPESFSPANPPINPEQCAMDCFEDRGMDHYDATCSDNLLGHCGLANGVSNYFSYFSKCFFKHCDDDKDRYDFVELFQEQCSSAKTTITSISGEFGKYLTRTSTIPEVESEVTTTSSASWSSESPSEPTSQFTPSMPMSKVTLKITPPSPLSTSSSSVDSPPPSADPSQPAPLPPAPTTIAVTVDHHSTRDLTTSSATSSSKAISSPTHTSNSLTNDKGKSAIAPTTIGGIAAGSAVGIALIFGLTVYFTRKESRRDDATPENGALPPHELSIRDSGMVELSGQSAIGIPSAPVGITKLDSAPTQRGYLAMNREIGKNF